MTSGKHKHGTNRVKPLEKKKRLAIAMLNKTMQPTELEGLRNLVRTTIFFNFKHINKKKFIITNEF